MIIIDICDDGIDFIINENIISFPSIEIFKEFTANNSIRVRQIVREALGVGVTPGKHRVQIVKKAKNLNNYQMHLNALIDWAWGY